jgi:hypothetical protein
MKKNAQLHLLIESSLLIRLKQEAVENSTNFAEYCRQKLRAGLLLDDIKRILKEKNGNK